MTPSTQHTAPSLGQTIRSLRQSHALSLTQLASLANCSKAYISAIETNKLRNPPRPHIITAIETALNLTPRTLQKLADWQSTPPPIRSDIQDLIAQLRNSPRRSDGSINLDALHNAPNLAHLLTPSSANIKPLPVINSRIPVINKVAAGYPSDFTDLDFPARIADEYITAPDVDDPDAFAARVVGKSMLPQYIQGDIIVFSPALEPTPGADCYVRILPDHQTTFKRIYPEPDDHIRLQPLNTDFPSQTLPLDQIAGLYPAILKIQPIDTPQPR